MAASGFFDALLPRFQSDGGSANARVQMFDLFAQLPLRDLMIGPAASLVTNACGGSSAWNGASRTRSCAARSTTASSGG